MSTITFVCNDSQKTILKSGVWEIIKDHYLGTVFPNSNAEYENEGEEVYRARMDTLMQEELCKIEETADGITVEFDSTEDAGFSIASQVYGTDMGYSDQGLTSLPPMFKEIVKKFPNIHFEENTECYDKWASSENEYTYDGSTLKMDGMDVHHIDLVMENMDNPFSPNLKKIAQKTGLSVDEIEEILDAMF